MEKSNRIALFIDVDNLNLTKENLEIVLKQLEEKGKIAFGKLFGVGEKRHKSIVNFAQEQGFEIFPQMRQRKRNSKIFDPRIFVEVMESVLVSKDLQSVAIVSQPTDFVHLFSKLRRLGLKIFCLENVDDCCARLSDGFVSAGMIVQKTFEKEDFEIVSQLKKIEQSTGNESSQDDEILQKIRILLEEFD